MRKIYGISILVILISLFSLSTMVMASPITYIVKSGDTLWSIANANEISIDSIKQLNGLSSDLIYAGQALDLSNSGVEQIVPSTPSVVSQSEYIVQTGDSLWVIAQKFCTTVDYLKIINGLTGDTIYVGNTLLVRGTLAGTTVSRSGESITGSQVVAKAAQYLGTPYVYGGTSPDGFDCSGFTQYVYSQFMIPLHRIAADQYSNGIEVSKADLAPGDLLFFNTDNGISHVGIYAGNGQFIHSSSGGGKVIFSILDNGYYNLKYVGARRIIR